MPALEYRPVVYVKQLVVRCRERIREVLAQGAGSAGWEFGSDVSLLLMALITYHSILMVMVRYVEARDPEECLRSARLAREWLAFAGDLLDLEG